jgi:hypothetical protein
MTLNGAIIKISFSDCGKRRDILGDEKGYELKETTCKLIHISLNKSSHIPQENNLKEILKIYGTILALNIKHNAGFRSSIYVEYSTPEEAENLIKQMMTNDLNGEKRKSLGDQNCEINFYFKKKNFMNNNNSYDYNHVNNMNSNLPHGNNMNYFNTKMPFNNGMNNQNPNMMQNMNMMNYNNNNNNNMNPQGKNLICVFYNFFY